VLAPLQDGAHLYDLVKDHVRPPLPETTSAVAPATSSTSSSALAAELAEDVARDLKRLQTRVDATEVTLKKLWPALSVGDFFFLFVGRGSLV
jgi:hypothetical protein